MVYSDVILKFRRVRKFTAFSLILDTKSIQHCGLDVRLFNGVFCSSSCNKTFKTKKLYTKPKMIVL